MSRAISKQLFRRVTATAQVVQLTRHKCGNTVSVRFLWTARRNAACAAQESAAETGSAAVEVGPKSAGPENDPSPHAKIIRGAPVSWVSFALLMSTGAGLLAYYDREKKQRIEVMKVAVAPTTGPSFGEAAIGGPFKLLNHENKVVTERDFVGNWTVVYFGFTFCPDICPQELTKLAKAVDNVADPVVCLNDTKQLWISSSRYWPSSITRAEETRIGLKIVPLFISVDPERDTPEQVRDYLKDYHPRLVGLTGSVNDIRQVARQYRVYYMKTEVEECDYLVDHSIIMYLMDPDMEFVKVYGKNYDVDALTAGIIEEIQKVLRK